jgi:hypothetical protein
VLELLIHDLRTFAPDLRVEVSQIDGSTASQLTVTWGNLETWTQFETKYDDDPHIISQIAERILDSDIFDRTVIWPVCPDSSLGDPHILRLSPIGKRLYWVCSVDSARVPLGRLTV